MKRIMKFTGTVLLIIFGMIVFTFIRAALTPAVPNNYTAKTAAGGEIEGRYLAAGEYKVKKIKVKTDEVFKIYEIYYPGELESSDRKYPAVIFVNGTGIKGSKYKALFKHLASWGFIVAGNEDDSSGSGLSTDKTLVYLLGENDDPNSVFYQKIDINNIGLSGHSQGGAGVLSALSINEHSSIYKTAAALSPTYEEMAHTLGWNYQLEKISVPILLLAGTEGDFEMNLVIPEKEMKSMFSRINAPKAMARRKNAEHGDMLYQADGYVTAWMMWQLQGDQEAAKAFTGERPELLNNSLYQEQKTEID